MSKDASRIGFCGGGQLALMMLPALEKFNLKSKVLDSENCPCHNDANQIHIGTFKNSSDVLEAFKDFSKDEDFVTSEIESVSIEGLEQIESVGVRTFPSSKILRIIQDKALQKQFFIDHQFPTSHFKLTANPKLEKLEIPSVIKLRKDGYDGKGVFIYRGTKEIPDTFEAPCIIEQAIKIKTEISVIVARSSKDCVTYDATEMVFDPELNLIDYTLYPARIAEELQSEAKELAKKICTALNYIGIMAVEMFITEDNKILINEIAPRPHNSGHHSIESSETSQFEQHIRAITNRELGPIEKKASSTLTYNLIGDPKQSGPYEVVKDSSLKDFPNIFIHLYNKAISKPGRKMGHVTITGNSAEEVAELYKRSQSWIQIKALTL